MKRLTTINKNDILEPLQPDPNIGCGDSLFKVMKIRLKEDTICAHDLHEMKHYPRPWFKAKPMLSAGTVLDVEKVWSNFFNTYYRCNTDDGEYDIPTYKAEEING